MVFIVSDCVGSRRRELTFQGTVNLNQIAARTDLFHDYRAFEHHQNYHGFTAALNQEYRIDSENRIVQGWIGDYDERQRQECLICEYDNEEMDE